MPKLRQTTVMKRGKWWIMRKIIFWYFVLFLSFGKNKVVRLLLYSTKYDLHLSGTFVLPFSVVVFRFLYWCLSSPLQICPLHSIPRPPRPVVVRSFGGKTAGNGANDMRWYYDSWCGRPREVMGDWCVESRSLTGEVEGTHWRGLSWPLTGMILYFVSDK